MKVNILGSTYVVEIIESEESVAGFCLKHERKIQIVNFRNHPVYKDESEAYIEALQDEALRHEVIHAFLFESGLKDSTCFYEGGWSTNEEMVDWFAIQGPKIVKAWKELGCLPEVTDG